MTKKELLDALINAPGYYTIDLEVKDSQGNTENLKTVNDLESWLRKNNNGSQVVLFLN